LNRSAISACWSWTGDWTGVRPVDDVRADALRHLPRTRRESHRAERRPAWAARSPCHSSRDLRDHSRPGRNLAAAWPGEQRPCGREDRKRERRKAWLRWPPSASLLADDAAAEAPDGTRTGRGGARRRTRRRKHCPAEILLETIRDIFPELGHFLRGAALGIDLHDRAAVDHRGSEIGGGEE